MVTYGRRRVLDGLRQLFGVTRDAEGVLLAVTTAQRHVLGGL